MLHDVQGVLAEPTVLAEIDGKCAVADNGVERRTEAIDIEAVGGNCLPRKFTPGTETTDVALSLRMERGACDVHAPTPF